MKRGRSARRDKKCIELIQRVIARAKVPITVVLVLLATAVGGFLGLFGSGRPAFAPVLDLGVITVSPVEKVRARLRDPGEDTIEIYYEAVERTIIPRVEDRA